MNSGRISTHSTSVSEAHLTSQDEKPRSSFSRPSELIRQSFSSLPETQGVTQPEGAMSTRVPGQPTQRVNDSPNERVSAVGSPSFEVALVTPKGNGSQPPLRPIASASTLPSQQYVQKQPIRSHTPPHELSQSHSPSPGRHSRIPSTGNRPTVMDVALALSAVPGSVSSHADTVPSGVSAREEMSPVLVGPPSAEKRKSSYDKYSSIIMPPLLEVATPIPSPANTLGRHDPITLPENLAFDVFSGPKKDEEATKNNRSSTVNLGTFIQ